MVILSPLFLVMVIFFEFLTFIKSLIIVIKAIIADITAIEVDTVDAVIIIVKSI